MSSQAKVYQMEGKYAQAETLAVKALEVRRRSLGEDHPDTLASENNLGTLYRCEGKYDQAGMLLTKALEGRSRVLGPEHPYTLTSRYELGTLKQSQGNYKEADTLFTSVFEVRRRVLGPSHPDTLDAMTCLGEVQLQEKRYVAAEPVLREALTGYETAASDSWQRYRSQSLLGGSLAAQSKYASAEPLLISGYEGLLQREATIPAEDRGALTQAGERIVHLYDEWGKSDKAAEWRENLRAQR
jgi:tetratricopeptide (TPR) repeat protein